MNIDLSTTTVRAVVKQVSTPSLGDHSYVLAVDGQAVAIDIQRDLDRFESALSGIDADLVGVFETHIHNDYVSGGKRLADAHGATYLLPANSAAPYSHTPIADGDTFPVGPWVIRAMHTPGHTHNHTSYVLESQEGPVAVFSGGSMLVGAVGRSDLLGPADTPKLLESQYMSVHRIADELPDPSVVAPTHGAGSFCSASDVADTTSTIGMEKSRNPALLAPSGEAFAAAQLASYRRFPVYYEHMAPMNLEPAGAPPSGAVKHLTDGSGLTGHEVVDIRPFDEYAAAHLPGSISVAASRDDATYIAWILPWNAPLVLVGGEEAVGEVSVHLHRIGWDNIVGRIDPEDLASFADSPLATTTAITFAELDSTAALIDVRDPAEHAEGIIEGATPVHFADFAANPGEYVDSDVVIHCLTGYRAGVAAGFAEGAGARATVVVDNLSNYKGKLVAPTV